MRWAVAWIGVWLAQAGMAAPLDSEAVTWINGFADRLEQQCVRRFDQRATELAGADLRTRQMLAIERRVNCECLPTRVRVRASAEVVAALRARDVAAGRAFMQAQAKVCGAQGLRESALPSCLASERERAFEEQQGRKPEGAEIDTLPAASAAMQATCDCYAERFGALDDANLIHEAEASDENFRQRVVDPAVPAFEGQAHAIMKECRSRFSR
jgi:hypothetical protein